MPSAKGFWVFTVKDFPILLVVRVRGFGNRVTGVMYSCPIVGAGTGMGMGISGVRNCRLTGGTGTVVGGGGTGVGIVEQVGISYHHVR